jgi:peptidoglycan/LPS O-acetylase OafA/YrhL
MGNPAKVVSDRIPGLDGIRSLAILAVLDFHFFDTPATEQASASMHGPAKIFYAVADNGWLGVDLFFVLSGFLITGILLDSRKRITFFQDFWIRRALRILPLVVAVVAILSFFYRPSALYALMALFFALDFAYPLHVVGNKAMGVLWSLAVEEQFYLVWPFLVFFLRLRTFTIITLALICIEPAIRSLVMSDRILMVNHLQNNLVWCRVDGLALGALIAIYVRSSFYSKALTYSSSAVAAVIGVVFLCLFYTNKLPSYGLYITAANLVFGAMVASAVAAGENCLWILRSRVAQFIANTSFCVYLIHNAFLGLAQHLGIAGSMTNPFMAATLQATFAIPLTFAVAALSRRYFELPILSLKNRYAPSRRASSSTIQAVPVGVEL